MCTTQTIPVFSLFKTLSEGNDLQHIDPLQFSWESCFNVYFFQRGILNISVQLFRESLPCTTYACVHSAAVCANWAPSLCCSMKPTRLFKDQNLESGVSQWDTSIQAGSRSCHRTAVFPFLCKSLWGEQNSHVLFSQHLTDCLNSLCTTRVTHEAPNHQFQLLYWKQQGQ